jgi:hypothetical protein
MSVIGFTHYPRAGEDRGLVMGVRVDGVDLRLLVAKAVAPLWDLELDDDDFDSVGERARFVLQGHDGLPVEDVAWPKRHFLGEIDPYYGSYDPRELPVLGCPCGLWGCWPLLARIAVDAGVVTWSGFRQPYRPQWGLLRLGPFEFDESAYAEQLASPTVLTADPLEDALEELDSVLPSP